MTLTKNKKRLKMPSFSYLLLVYIILAAGWWAILLSRLNQESHEAQIKVYDLEAKLMAQENPGTQLHTQETLREVTKKFTRQRDMIYGETIFFLISIIAGVIIIYQAIRARIGLAKRQRNFILAVTHELKSPLTTIQMVLETFHRKSPNPEQQKLLTEGALVETNRLKQLVDNLLAVARTEEMREEADTEIDLHPLIDEIIVRYQSAYPKAHFSVIKNATDSRIRIQQADLTQILNNLIENAIKYAGDDAGIILTTTSDDKNILLRVVDNGPGIPIEEKDNVFKLFYRIGTEENRNSTGTGIGLYIVALLMKKIKGQITIEQNVPRGAIFSLQFNRIL